MIETTTAAIESATAPDTLSKKNAIDAAMSTAALRSVSAQTCYSLIERI
jgi:hypothetical protein